jgi:hypothetical protein
VQREARRLHGMLRRQVGREVHGPRACNQSGANRSGAKRRTA